MTTFGEPVLSIAEFQTTAVDTLDRINPTQTAEFITVAGDVRGVLMPPDFYRRDGARVLVGVRRCHDQAVHGRTRRRSKPIG